MYIKNFYNNNLEKEKQLEESYSLTSDYTTKLQSSKQYGTGTETGTQISGAAVSKAPQVTPVSCWA